MHPDELDNLTTLLPYNRDVNQENFRILVTKAQGQVIERFAAECSPSFTVLDQNKNLDSTQARDWLQQMCASHPASADLRLAVGALVMLLANLDLKRGLANGTLGVVVAWRMQGTRRLPVVRFSPPNHPAIEQTVDVHSWDRKYGSIRAVYSQIPLRLCWRTTIHKAQGLTLQRAAMNLSRLRTPGQMYTALSRVPSFDSLVVLDYDPHSLKVDQDALQYYKRIDAL
jgi:ATP-dependent exoDNAse (exonuclease V) alpha subunit